MTRRVRFGRVARWTLLAVAASAAAVSLPGCEKGDDGWPKDRSGPKVVVSFAPLYCFAVNVAGDDAVVRNLLTTTGPHHFNPTDKDARLLRRADVFFVNGLGLEGDKPDRMKKGSGNRNLKVVELGGRIPAGNLCEGSCTHDHGDGDHHDHGKDPHVWLSLDQAVYLIEGIRDELKAADPAHGEGYARRATEYVTKLQNLKSECRKLLEGKKDKRLVTFHDSMAYFAKCFDVEIVGVLQKNPGSEPTGKELEKLIALCTNPANPVRVVCVEPQYVNSNAGTELVKILKDKGVADPVLVELDPLETVPPDQLTADWYEKKMLANVRALAEKMK